MSSLKDYENLSQKENEKDSKEKLGDKLIHFVLENNGFKFINQKEYIQYTYKYNTDVIEMIIIKHPSSVLKENKEI